MKNIKILISPIVYLMSFYLIEFFISIIIKIILIFDIKFPYIYTQTFTLSSFKKKILKIKKNSGQCP